MAQTAAERQAACRRRRASRGPNGDGDRQLNTWVATGAALALERLARHNGVSQRAMLERLILAADDRITRRLDPTSPAWAAYFNVTR